MLPVLPMVRIMVAQLGWRRFRFTCLKSECCSHLVAAPNHAHGTSLSAVIPVRGSTVDNKSDEALRRNGGSTSLRDGKRVSS